MDRAMAVRTGAHRAPPATSRYRYSKRRYRWLFGFIDSICTPVVRIRRALTPQPPWPEPRSILVVQLDHVGDAVLTTPMLAALARRFPAAAIDVLASEWNQDVFRAVPCVRKIHLSARNWQSREPHTKSHLSEVLRLGRLLHRERYDLGIDPRGDFPVAMILWLAGIKRRLGWSSGGGGFLLTDTPPWNDLRHEVDSRLALLEPLGVRDGERHTRLEPSWPDKYAVREGLSCLPDNRKPIVVLHVSAGTQAKRWPVSYMAELIRQLIGELSCQIILVGEAHERNRSRNLRVSSPHVLDWTGRLTLQQLAALLEEVDLFIGADSGPAHVAASVDTPSVVLFSGTNRQERWRPTAEKLEVVHWPVPCSPCHLKECHVPGHPCMTGIRPSDVMEAVRRLLPARVPQPKRPKHRRVEESN